MDGAQSLAIGALALDPANPSTLWVGTGESTIARLNFGGGGLYRVKSVEAYD